MYNSVKSYAPDNEQSSASTQEHEAVREPDNISKNHRDGTTYTIREFMVGKEAVADIITRRIIRELELQKPQNSII
jgi:hypothetical protein